MLTLDSSQQAKSVRQAVARTGRFTEMGTRFLCLLFLSRIIDKNSYPDFLIIQTIPGKADNYRLLSKKSRDNFFKKGRYQTAQMQMR